jgi:type I restriction-modification system DNA methylase subunit
LLIKNNDKMNEKYVQKLQGAFFTPPHYVRFSTEMVNNAITQSRKEGYDDYVIIDRCAGVGNLQSQFTHENEKHMILGTINEAEASILELCDISCC